MLKLNNVQKTYDNFSLNCSLSLRPGYITGLIGTNGAGKTTVFKSALGLINLDGGEVSVLGKDPKKLMAEDRNKIGVVLSDSGYSGYLSVLDVSKLMKNFYPSFDRAKFLKQCEQSDLPLKKQIKDFSTGMKAKLKLLTAMSYNAKLLILDEPTAGLDVIAREELLDRIRDYMDEKERSVLISSHISGDLESICDDLYLIDQGKIILYEETHVLLGDYGLLKVSEEQYQTLDKKYVLRIKKESYGYRLLSDHIKYYKENSKDIIIEKGSIDEVITMMIRGECL
ncbi:ABC transporter ATP-binding protein [Clostridium sp. E02]|uniref:ABC transporter ATP-binding protein n=1 Tax=Clostridium sp. E02 TaxID=2487134 RepID=UPI000F51BE29|nr:ABC transporter ATP-binding protein [Clostridium sp. E02]